MRRIPLLLLPLAALLALWVGMFLDREGADHPREPLVETAPTSGAELEAKRGPAPDGTEVVERERISEAGAAPIVRAEPLRPLEVKGTVVDDEGRLISGGRVHLHLRRGNAEAVPLGFAAAPSGVFTTHVEVPAGLLEGRGAVVVLEAVARAPLHRRSRTLRRDLLTAERPVTLDLVVSRGATVRGRVLDAQGQVVSNARVILTDESGGEEIEPTAPDGTYELDLFEPGLHELQALHPGVGQSPRLRFDLDPSRDFSAPDLSLRGGGSLAGTTRYPDGSVAARVHVLALPERDLPPPEVRFWYDDLPERNTPGVSNLTLGAVVSDEAGHFRFEGLQEGKYFLLVDEPGYDREMVRELFATGAEGIECVVNFYRVRLRVTDEHGRPIQGAHFTYSVGIENESGGSSGWTRWPEGVAYFHGFRYLRPGGTASAEAWIPSSPRARGERRIVEGFYETRLDLVLEEPSDLATLKLEVATSDGVPLERCEVDLKRVDEFWDLHEFVLASDRPTSLQLPPGRYRLVASALKPQLGHALGIEELDLDSGEERSVRVVLPATGTLQVHVHRPPGRDWIRLNAVRLLELPAPGDPPGSEPESTLSGKLSYHLKDHCRDHADESDPYAIPSFQLLDPGPHRLELEFVDCVPVVHRVEIQASRTEELEIWLELL